ncbi:CAZyme family GH18 [Penicillium roqueforti]|nr:CAZyme family GH18 [Penicillium roqueforti]
MATGQAFKKEHFFRVLFGIVLGLLCLVFWPHSLKLSGSSIARRASTVDSLEVNNHVSISARDDYSCSASNPCSNGACCGASGYCGYGDTYCGKGCVSNCDAIAECGKYTQPANKTCPLNTCCSEFGFCGTTKDFCNDACQSNCHLNVTVPAGGSSSGVLQNKVIGYYEAWMARKSCHKIKPVNLPLDALTHVNFAFASIDPSTYQVVAMDSATPTSLFSDVTNLKSVKEDIKVYVSIGGWTFSDNGTDTQPVFGDIAASTSNRKKFANNVVHFMRQYGFDGVDLDWEYPGAGDRGGKARDTENYVLLLKTLKEVFDDSGNKYGLTFTAPSSYWYLRWFDLPKMVKYADWINIMTYDLHGVWDASNPIGSILQGHTNLTEIKSALDLFWRVEVPPSKVVLGLGFYGRAFTLQDKECSKPGCAFKGASGPGSCSDTAGMLAYYEIASILQGTSKKRATISPVHDKEAAVNYFTFDDNQWVSYDDKTTFKQKVSWADEVGLGGAMIWASDLDTDKYDAHTDLIDREIISTSTLKLENKAKANPGTTVEDLSAFTGQKCFKHTGKCLKIDDTKAMSKACGSGYTVVGWDDAGCGKSNCHCGKPICCPTGAAPKNCMWRGQDTGQKGASSDCSGQCAAGEINVAGIRSSWGGGYLNDKNTGKCGRGYKAFCCPDPDYKQVTKTCSWAKCGENCPPRKSAVLTKYDECYSKGRKYCCSDPAELVSCQWENGSGGDGDCANAVCNSTQVEIAKSTLGDGSTSCEWGRQRSGCCTVTKAPTRKATCTYNICDLDSDYCYSDPLLYKRDDQDTPDSDYSGDDSSIAKRAGRERKTFKIVLGTFSYWIAGYPSIGKLLNPEKYGAALLTKAFRTRSGFCAGSTLDIVNLPKNPTEKQRKDLDTEHPLDKGLQGLFYKYMGNRELPGDRSANFPKIDPKFWDKFNEPNAKLGAMAQFGKDRNGKKPMSPAEYLAEAYGSERNPRPFMPVENGLNIAKRDIFLGKSPVQATKLRKAATSAVKADTDTAADKMLSLLQTAFSSFEYIRNEMFLERFDGVIDDTFTAWSNIEQATETYNLQNWHGLVLDAQFTYALDQARRWARESIRIARAPYVEAYEAGRSLATYDRVMTALDQFEDLISQIKMPDVTSEDYKKRNPYNGEGPSGSNS